MQIVDHRSMQASGPAAAQGMCRPLLVPGTADEAREAGATDEAGAAFEAFEASTASAASAASTACGERDAPGFPRRSLAGRQPRSLQPQGAGRLSYRELHRQHYRPRSNRVPRWLQQVWAWL